MAGKADIGSAEVGTLFERRGMDTKPAAAHNNDKGVLLVIGE